MSKGYIPQRRCLGCRLSKDKTELIRLTDSENGLLFDDKKALGRGCYICKSKACYDAATKNRALERNFKRKIEKEEYERLLGYILTLNDNGGEN